MSDTPRTDAIPFSIGSDTPLDDAFHCFERLHKVSCDLERDLAATNKAHADFSREVEKRVDTTPSAGKEAAQSSTGTPRTDAVVRSQQWDVGDCYRLHELAKQLERELVYAHSATVAQSGPSLHLLLDQVRREWYRFTGYSQLKADIDYALDGTSDGGAKHG